MWRAKERRESKHPLPDAPYCGLWTVDAAPTIACHHAASLKGVKGIGDLASWPLLGDGWMVEAGGLRTSRLLAVGLHKCRLQS
jgi:hypothetical protein